MSSTGSLEKGKISALETFLLLFTLVVATGILFVPAITAETAGPDGWISLFTMGTLWGIAVALVLIKLGKMFPGKTLVEYSEEILGSYLGKLISLLYVFWFILINAIILREFTDFLLSVYLPETPITAFAVTAILLSVYLVFGGIEVIARANLFISPILFAAFILISFLSLGDLNIKNLTPVMENGILPVLKGSITPMFWRGEIILLAMFLPFMNKPEQGKKVAILAVICIGLFLAFNSVLVIALLGVNISASQVFPTFIIAAYIEVGQFLQRLEAFIMLMWVTGVVIKLAIFHYVASLATAQIFNLKEYKPMVIPIALITSAWSVTSFENVTELKEFLAGVLPVSSFPFELFIPLGLLFLALVRNKGEKNKKPNITILPNKRGETN